MQLRSTKTSIEQRDVQEDGPTSVLPRPSELLATYPVTLGITLCTLLLHLELWMGTPELIPLLQLQLDPIQFPRILPQLITGNVVHWSTGHLLTDLSAFFLLGLLYERRGSLPFLGSTLLGAVLTSLAVFFFHPEVTVYRGLSGVNHGLLAYGILSGVRTGNVRDVLMGILFAIKLIWEVATGVLVLPTGTTFSPAFAEYSHAGGALGGAIVFLVFVLCSGRRSIGDECD